MRVPLLTRGLIGVSCLLAFFTIVGSSLQAQENIVAFGDSITEGLPPFDEDRKGGYPGRLQTILRSSGISSATVLNEGHGSETTSEGLTRINSVISANKAADLFIIMEGTNDVNLVNSGLLSMDTVLANLEGMAGKVRSEAIDVLYATIIPRPPWAKQDSTNFVTFELIFGLRELTSTGRRDLAEPYEILENRELAVYKKYYFKKDPVGHPNSAGFALLAEHFAEKVLGEDTLAPVVSGFSKNRSGQFLANGDQFFALVHESGTGIAKVDSYFTLNGRSIDTDVEGTTRRTSLSYRVTNSDIACGGRITVRTEDRANPANVRNRLVAEYKVEGAQLLKGDVNGDCRVNGFDLGLLGPSFGSKRGDVNYSELADANNDDSVDGDDLAKLARNFGKSSD